MAGRPRRPAKGSGSGAGSANGAMRQLLMNSLATPKTRIVDGKLVVEQPSKMKNFFSLGSAGANARNLRSSMQLNKLSDDKAEKVANKLQTRRLAAAKLAQTNAVNNIDLATDNRRETNRQLAKSDRRLTNLNAKLAKTAGENTTKEKKKQLKDKRDIEKAIRAEKIKEAKEADSIVNMATGRALAIRKLRTDKGISLKAAVGVVESMELKDLENSGRQFNKMNELGPKMISALKDSAEVGVLNSPEGKKAYEDSVIEKHNAAGVVNDLNRASTRTQNLTGTRIKQTTENEDEEHNSYRNDVNRNTSDALGENILTVNPDLNAGKIFGSQVVTRPGVNPSTTTVTDSEGNLTTEVVEAQDPFTVFYNRQDKPRVPIPGSPDAGGGVPGADPRSVVGETSPSPRLNDVFKAQNKHEEVVRKQTRVKLDAKLRELKEKSKELGAEAKRKPGPEPTIFNPLSFLPGYAPDPNHPVQIRNEGQRIDGLMQQSLAVEAEIKAIESQIGKSATTPTFVAPPPFVAPARERKVIPIPAIPTPATLPSQPIPPSRSPAMVPGPLPTGQPAIIRGGGLEPRDSGVQVVPVPTAPDSASAEPAGLLQKLMQAGSVKAMGQDAAKSAVDSDGLFGQVVNAGSVKELGQEKFKAAIGSMLSGLGGGGGEPSGMLSKLIQGGAAANAGGDGMVKAAAQRKLKDKLGSKAQLDASSSGDGGKNFMNLLTKFFI